MSHIASRRPPVRIRSVADVDRSLLVAGAGRTVSAIGVAVQFGRVVATTHRREPAVVDHRAVDTALP